MNKKSIAALALAAVMTFGVGASSYAWFTSQAKSTNNTIQTGTLAIGLAGTSAQYPFTLNNLYPGIEGSKTGHITVKNNGSINLMYKISSVYAGGDQNLYNIADLKITTSAGAPIFSDKLYKLSTALANVTLPVGKTETLNYTVSLPGEETGNYYQDKVAYINFVFDAAQYNTTSDWIGGNGYGSVVNNKDGSINLSGDEGGPFSYNFSNKGAWSGSYYAETSIYLDPAMALGKGFDYSVAMGKEDGSHLRDFIFHVTKDTSTGKLLVGASNNTNFAVREDLDVNFTNNEITEAGWYTFQHRFYKNGSNLEAQLSIIDKNQNVVFSKIINTTDTSFEVPKYSWATFITVPGGINVQNHRDYVTP